MGKEQNKRMMEYVMNQLSGLLYRASRFEVMLTFASDTFRIYKEQ